MAKRRRRSKTAEAKRPPGRPSKFTQALADEICERMSNGEGLMAICKDDHMPDRRTVQAWLTHEGHAGFHRAYARARELQADAFFEQSLRIADDPCFDWVERTMKNGESIVVADYEHIQRSKLRVDTRKWAAGRMAPWKYGDRVEHAVASPTGKTLADLFIAVRRAKEGHGAR